MKPNNLILSYLFPNSHTSSWRNLTNMAFAHFCYRRYQDCAGVFGAGLKLRRHSPPTSRSEESAWRRAAPSKPPAGGGVGGGSDGAAAAAAAAVTVSACRDAAIIQAALAPCSTAARTWGWGSAFG